jgi:cob(I)alamin adenosyltransferase
MKTKFFTGEGDRGESRVGAKKLSKTDPALAFLGSLDELNSWLGVCRTGSEKKGNSRKKGVVEIGDVLKGLQQALFIAQAEVAAAAFGYPPGPQITSASTERIEDTIRLIDEKLGAIRSFIISGGSELAAMLDFGRTIARRVERDAVGYNLSAKSLRPELLTFLNRLSSLIFALARYANHLAGVKEEKPDYR